MRNMILFKKMFEFSLACSMLKDVVIGPHQGGSKTAQAKKIEDLLYQNKGILFSKSKHLESIKRSWRHFGPHVDDQKSLFCKEDNHYMFRLHERSTLFRF